MQLLRSVLTGLLCSLVPGIVAAQTPTGNAPLYVGQLDPVLQSGVTDKGIRLRPVTRDTLLRFRISDTTSLQRLIGGMAIVRSIQPLENDTLSVIYLTSGTGVPRLYVDLNRDGKMTPGEQVPLHDVTDGRKSKYVRTLQSDTVLLPCAANAWFKSYPVQIRVMELFTPSRDRDSTSTLATVNMQWREPMARGQVDIASQQTLVRFPVLYPSGKVYLTWRQDIDSNGDGRIDGMATPLEMQTGRGKRSDIVFHVGQQYVSVDSVDPRTGRITYRQRLAADYLPIDTRIGNIFPNFAFTDIDGTHRTLADYRGKYVLLDAWGTWCHACMDEVPNLRDAYAKYRARGFEIIGINLEDDPPPDSGRAYIENLRVFLNKHGMTWPQASVLVPQREGESVKQLIRDRLMLFKYPTVFLLAPDGRIVSTDLSEPPILGVKLLNTLEQLLPALPPGTPGGK